MAVLYPSFALFALTIFCIFRLGISRYRAVAAGRVDHRYFRDYRGYDEPDDLRIQSRHVVNLLEVPVLFYAGSIIAYISGSTGTVVVSLCWTYVALRYLHSFVHLTSNRVMLRFRLFGLSLLVLTAIWAVSLANMVK